MPPVAPSPFAPSPNPPDSLTSLFRTVNLNFVAAALAADLFRYVGAEPFGVNANFVLADPGDQGAELLRQWNAGIFPKVHPRVFMEARSFLQQEVQRVRRTAVAR